MTKAFCPGHITCFFSPMLTDDPMTSGSLGAGIRLDKGVTVALEERSDAKIVTTMDGETCDAKVSKRVIEMMAPGTGFDVTMENELPVSQGLGMSAAGAVAVGLCVSSFTGADELDAYRMAHIAELEKRGGLGDVAGIMGGRQPVRIKAGIPPFGRVIDTGITMKVTVATLGPKVNTGSVLGDNEAMGRIRRVGIQCVNEYINKPTESSLYEISSRFSRSIGLETTEIRNALLSMRAHHKASVCMLGNTIFTDASKTETSEILGDDISVTECSSCSKGPKITRKA